MFSTKELQPLAEASRQNSNMNNKWYQQSSSAGVTFQLQLLELKLQSKIRSFIAVSAGGLFSALIVVVIFIFFSSPAFLWEILKANSLKLETWQKDSRECCPIPIQVVSQETAIRVLCAQKND